MQLHGCILLEIWLNMPTTLTVCPSGKMLTDQNKLVLQFELLMFGFLSFFAGLPDDISAADVSKDRANIRLPASQPSSQWPSLQNCDEKCISTFPPAGRAPVIYVKCRNKIPRKRCECTLTSAAFSPVCRCLRSQRRPLPG